VGTSTEQGICNSSARGGGGPDGTSRPFFFFSSAFSVRAPHSLLYTFLPPLPLRMYLGPRKSLCEIMCSRIAFGTPTHPSLGAAFPFRKPSFFHLFLPFFLSLPLPSFLVVMFRMPITPIGSPRNKSCMRKKTRIRNSSWTNSLPTTPMNGISKTGYVSPAHALSVLLDPGVHVRNVGQLSSVTNVNAER